MKIKKGKKYLTYVSGLGNPDETLVSETLQILEINGDDCVAKGLGTGHVYKIKKTEIENKVMSKTKKEWSCSFDDGFLITTIIAAIALIVFFLLNLPSFFN